MQKKSLKQVFIEQGSIHKHQYFEGWYFKQVNLTLKKSISFIFGYSTNELNPHSFVQIIKTHPLRSYYIRYPLASFKTNKDGYQIDQNTFTKHELTISIDQNDIRCFGTLQFSDHNEIHSNNRYMPNIMGPFTYIPNMECNHGVVSMSHIINGEIHLDSECWTFMNDIGYCEKDWGTSFPKRYIWIQGNHFEHSNASFMLSIADIPFLGVNFEGLIAQLNISDKSYRFATYTGAFKQKLTKNSDGFDLIIQRGFYRLKIVVKTDEKIDLISPKNGLMENTIKEGLGGEIAVSLYHFNKQIWSDTSKHCGVEIEGY